MELFFTAIHKRSHLSTQRSLSEKKAEEEEMINRSGMEMKKNRLVCIDKRAAMLRTQIYVYIYYFV